MLRPALSRALVSIALAWSLVMSFTTTATGAPTHAWTRQFGASEPDGATAIAVHSLRAVYVVGCVEGALPHKVDHGGRDAFVRKYRPDGHVAWTRQFGSSGDDCAIDGVVDAGGRVYVAGWTAGALPGKTNRGGVDAFVRKYRPDGHVAWTRQFGTSGDDEATALATDANRRLYVAGRTRGALPGQANQGNYDAFVRKLRPDGTGLWTHQFGTSSLDEAAALATDPAGDIVVTGYTTGTFPGQASRGGDDVFVRKYRPDGHKRWTRQFGTSGDDDGTAIATDATSRIYVGGWTSSAFPGQASRGSDDAFVRKLRPDGSGLWTRQFGTPGSDEVRGVTTDPAGRVYVAARLGSGLGGTQDGHVRKLKPDGSVAWTRRVGLASSRDDAADIALDRRGRIYVAGSTNGTLGPTPAGGFDAFVRKYRP